MVKYFVWNFDDKFWIFTLNILSIHWTVYLLDIKTQESLALRALKDF